MKRKRALFVLLLTVIVLTLLAAGQAAAKPKFPAAVEVDWVCFPDYGPPAEVWWADDTVHGRNISEYHVMTGGFHEDTLRKNYVVVNWNLNTKTGEGTAWGTFAQEILGDEGNWYPLYEGTWEGKLTKTEYFFPWGMELWEMDGRSVGHGVGDYAGAEVRSDLHLRAYDPDDVFADPTDYPCYQVYGVLPEPMLSRGTNISYQIPAGGE